MIKTKRGYYFSVDALIALLIILGVVLFLKPQLTQIQYETHLQEDLIIVLSSLEIGDLDNQYAEQLISSGNITNLNQSVLDQLGEFYANNDPAANILADSILDYLDLSKNVGLYFGSTEIAKFEISPYNEADTIYTSRQIISGIQQGNATKGYSARAFLSSENKVDYFYFGGYIGDGNITVKITGEVLGANIEGVFSGPFNISINNANIGYFNPPADIPFKIDLTPYIKEFINGDNYIVFKSSESDLYIAGGFIRIVYASVPYLNGRKNFPGIDGLINLYDSFYVPSAIQNLEALIHYNSSYDIFLMIANKTVYQGNSGGQEMNVVLNDTYLRSILDTSGGLGPVKYPNLHNKTIPFRIGLKNASYTLNESTFVDVLSVTDISGSMFGQRITDAKNANIVLINAILNHSGNYVGLAAYSTWAKKNDFHPLSNNSVSLKNEVNSWNAQDYTCICCGILKTINCFDKNIFLDSFNGQTTGTNPIGWSLIEGNGAIDITSSSLEGDKAVKIERLSSQNPLMSHYFPPQQDKITTEFLVRHNSGSGRVRIEIEGANDGYSSFQDYIIIKMYGGWIRNNDAQVISYNLNTIYKIKIEVIPGASTYDLYIDDLLVGNDLPVLFARTNVARVSFTTESSNVNYTFDDVKVFLIDSICNVPEGKRNRVAIVMSDGQGNRACGLDPVPDYDQDGDITDDPKDHAIEAACIAKQKHNITVHAVGFGTTADELTLQKIALQCGGGSYYFSDVGGLVALYTQIAQDIISASYVEQTIVGEGINTKLYPDSHINISYKEVVPYGLVVSSETPEFNNNLSLGTFFIPNDTILYEAKVVSYSGSKWTSKVEKYNTVTGVWDSIFDLGEYGTNFTNLGDPYMVNIPPSLINMGNNSVRVYVGLNPSNSSAGSQYNKIIYSILKEISSYTSILPFASGCEWQIEFEDASISTIRVPSNYSGANTCFYTSSSQSYDSNDAISNAVFNLLLEMDLNLNSKIETKFSENDLSINSVEVAGIPFAWETEVQVRSWK